MSTVLIELRDHNLCVRAGHEVLARSPGFASIASDTPVFGESAREQARLHPRHSFNQFWSQLGMETLPIKNKFFRHNADLAYSHLDGVTRSLDLSAGAVLAVPSHYTRQQLAVLLGVVKQCRFTTVGLIDLALLQAATTPAEHCVVIDLQLHQAVLTSFRKVDGQLVRERVLPVPFSGLLALQDAWVNVLGDEFVRHSRFDPQRNAETEQFMTNQLSTWIAASQANGEALIEINLKGTVFQARVSYAQFEQRVQGIYTRIREALAELSQDKSAVHISSSLLSLPGLTQGLPGLIAVDDEQGPAVIQQFRENIASSPDNIVFTSRLPLIKGTVSTVAPVMPPRLPTHILLNHRALLLPTGRTLLGSTNGAIDYARQLPLPDQGFQGAIALLRSSKGVQLELHTQQSVLLNGKPAANNHVLVPGDALQIGNGPQLHLITVEASA